MPQELSITSSTGQEQPSNDSQATIPIVATDSPIFVHSEGHFGATQPPPFATTFASPHPSPEGTTLTGVGSPTIPTGVAFRPRLKLAISGRAPRLKTRQLWEGTVTEVKDSGFVAVLSDKTNPRNPDEQATFEFDNTEISPEDFALINPGSSFYWVIGNEKTPAGQVKNVSMLLFRRIPAWTQRGLDRAGERARRLREELLEEL